MPICPILKWYMPDNPNDPRDLPYPISSVVEGSIKLIEIKGKKKDTYKVRIVTKELEKHQMYFECGVTERAMKVLEYEAKYQSERTSQHYGLIILEPGLKMKDSTVMDFISYHRHPTAFTTEPTECRYDIAVYNEVFEMQTLKERALTKFGDSKRKQIKQAARRITREALAQRVSSVLE